MKKFVLKIPATSANLGPGLDCLALALTLYNQFEVESSNQTVLHYQGFQESNSQNPQKNLTVQTCVNICQHHGWPCPNFNLNCTANIPMAGGLGSSATAVLAGVIIARLLNERTVDPKLILQDALKIENHPDNLCAALYGGFTTAFLNGKEAIVLPTKIEYPMCCWVLYPQNKAVKTQESRQQLPNNFSMADLVFSLSRACTLTAALCNGQLSFLFEAMKDKLHEPWRMDAKMEYPLLKSKLQSAEFYGWSISGSGPAVIIFCKSITPHLQHLVAQHFQERDTEFRSYPLSVDNQGLCLNQQPLVSQIC